MSTATIRSPALRQRPNLDRQIAQAKAVLRELRDTLEDRDDCRELALARQRNAGKRGTGWETVKNDLFVDPLASAALLENDARVLGGVPGRTSVA